MTMIHQPRTNQLQVGLFFTIYFKSKRIDSLPPFVNWVLQLNTKIFSNYYYCYPFSVTTPRSRPTSGRRRTRTQERRRNSSGSNSCVSTDHESSFSEDESLLDADGASDSAADGRQISAVAFYVASSSDDELRTAAKQNAQDITEGRKTSNYVISESNKSPTENSKSGAAVSKTLKASSETCDDTECVANSNDEPLFCPRTSDSQSVCHDQAEEKVSISEGDLELSKIEGAEIDGKSAAVEITDSDKTVDINVTLSESMKQNQSTSKPEEQKSATTETRDYSDDFDTDSSSNSDNNLPSKRITLSPDDEPTMDPKNSDYSTAMKLNLGSDSICIETIAPKDGENILSEVEIVVDKSSDVTEGKEYSDDFDSTDSHTSWDAVDRLKLLNAPVETVQTDNEIDMVVSDHDEPLMNLSNNEPSTAEGDLNKTLVGHLLADPLGEVLAETVAEIGMPHFLTPNVEDGTGDCVQEDVDSNSANLPEGGLTTKTSLSNYAEEVGSDGKMDLGPSHQEVPPAGVNTDSLIRGNDSTPILHKPPSHPDSSNWSNVKVYESEIRDNGEYEYVDDFDSDSKGSDDTNILTLLKLPTEVVNTDSELEIGTSDHEEPLMDLNTESQMTAEHTDHNMKSDVDEQNTVEESGPKLKLLNLPTDEIATDSEMEIATSDQEDPLMDLSLGGSESSCI